MNVILLVAATILAVASSEPIGDRQTQDIKDIPIEGPNDRNNSFQATNEKESEDYDQTNGSNWLDAVPGVPGKDYPNLKFIPKTSFTCSDKKPGGYYADIETRCQVFHVCNVGDVKSSFLCPPGSIFNQKYLVCDWWYDFECEHASDLFSLKDSVNYGPIESNFNETGEYYRTDENSRLGSRNESSFDHQESNSVNDETDLSLAGTGEGGPGYSRNISNRRFENSDQVNSHQNRKHSSQMVQTLTFDNESNKNDRFNDYKNENSNRFNNIQSPPVDFLQTRKKFDSVPRGFAINYGKSKEIQNPDYNANFENRQVLQNNQRNEFFSSDSRNFFTTPSVVNFLRKESHFDGENYNVPYQSTEKTENRDSGRYLEEDNETSSNFDEDQFDRKRQLEVDNAVLNKKAINFENTRYGEFNFDYDSESKRLSSEEPPSQDNGNYYNYYEEKSNSQFPSGVTSKPEENFSNRNKNNDQTQNSGKFNGNSETSDRMLENDLRPPSFSTSSDLVNSNLKGFTNKGTVDHSGIIPNSENNGFFSSGTQPSTGSRSFSQISEFTSGHDSSRLIEDKSDLRQSHNDKNQQNSYNYNAGSHYGSFNYENGNQPQTKEF